MSTTNPHPRILRERKTLSAMVDLYCREQHHPDAVARFARCPQCQELLDYALGRLERCPFQEKKSTCAKCLVHCYQPWMTCAPRRSCGGMIRRDGIINVARPPCMAVVQHIKIFLATWLQESIETPSC